MNEAVSPIRVVGAILLRDMTVTRRELVSFLLRTSLQPILFVIVFGFVLPRMGLIQRGYTTMMLPGIVALSLALSAIQSVAMPMLVEFGRTNEIEDRLLAPIPTPLVAVEKIIFGLLQGMFAAIFVLPISRLIMGPIPGLTFRNVPLLLAIAILSGAAFAAIGLFLGTAVAPQQIGVIFTVVLGPMIMFGCTYYPWAGLERIPAMKWAVLINPLVYVSEGMRASLTPAIPHMPLLGLTGALVAILVLFLWLGLRAFQRRAIS